MNAKYRTSKIIFVVLFLLLQSKWASAIDIEISEDGLVTLTGNIGWTERAADDFTPQTLPPNNYEIQLLATNTPFDPNFSTTVTGLTDITVTQATFGGNQFSVISSQYADLSNDSEQIRGIAVEFSREIPPAPTVSTSSNSREEYFLIFVFFEDLDLRILDFMGADYNKTLSGSSFTEEPGSTVEQKAVYRGLDQKSASSIPLPDIEFAHPTYSMASQTLVVPLVEVDGKNYSATFQLISMADGSVGFELQSVVPIEDTVSAFSAAFSATFFAESNSLFMPIIDLFNNDNLLGSVIGELQVIPGTSPVTFEITFVQYLTLQ